MGLQVVVDEFTPADMQAVLEIETQAFTDEAYSEEMFDDLFHEQGILFLVARNDQDIIGYIVAAESDHLGYIVSIAVHDDYRRQGLGQRLVEEIIKRFARRNVEEITLHVNTNNAAAIHFYVKLRFLIEFTEPDYYSDGASAYYMRLPLSPDSYDL